MLISKQLAVNITVGATWTQVQEGGVGYTVPSSGSTRGDLRLIRAVNLSSGSASVQMAISSSSPPGDVNKIWPETFLEGGSFINDDSIHVMRGGEKLWARVSSTLSINVTVRGSVLEVR